MKKTAEEMLKDRLDFDYKHNQVIHGNEFENGYMAGYSDAAQFHPTPTEVEINEAAEKLINTPENIGFNEFMKLEQKIVFKEAIEWFKNYQINHAK